MGGRLPRKVLHVLNGAGGGAAITTASLVRGLARLGVRSSAVCHAMGSPEEWESLRETFGGEVERVELYWWNRKIRSARWKRPLLETRQLLRTGAMAGSSAQVAAAARRFGAELIHTNTLLTPEGARAARLLRLPHVWHVRELIGAGQPFQLPLEGDRLARYLRSHASLVIANSEASAAALRPVVLPERLRVVPNGIELGKLIALGPRSPGSRPVVAMVANLTSRTKRHDLFVEAIRQVGPGVDARIYGGGGDRESDAYVRSLKAAAAGAGVELRGFAPADQVMAEIDVLVQPAENESFGRTVVEAMAAAVAVVGADGGGVGELVDDGITGLKFAPGSAEGLARCIQRVCAEAELRSRLGAAGRQRARERFSAEAMSAAVARGYEDAMRYPLHATWEGLAEAFGLA